MLLQPSAATITSALVCLQDAETNWQFDIFAFAAATPGATLALMTFHLLSRAHCINELNVDQGKFWNFLQKVEGGYRCSYVLKPVVASILCLTAGQTHAQEAVTFAVALIWPGALQGRKPLPQQRACSLGGADVIHAAVPWWANEDRGGGPSAGSATTWTARQLFFSL